MTKIQTLSALIVTLLAITAAIAYAVTPTGTSTYGGYQVTTVTQSLTLTDGYAGALANCPDGSWSAVGGGYHFGQPSPFADDISIRASQRNVDGNGIEGWLVSAKWNEEISGESRVIVSEATCTRLGSS